MMPPSTDLDIASLAASLRGAVSGGVNHEDLIQRMRAMGLNQIACIKMLRDVTKISLGEAKEEVHFSVTWADRRTINGTLHEAAFTAAEELGYRPTVPEA